MKTELKEETLNTKQPKTGKRIPNSRRQKNFTCPDMNQVTFFLSFFAPIILMIVIFIGNDIYPFGNRSFLFSDMYHQYMPFFQAFVNKVRSGESFGYTWNVGMGSNFLALYIYYLASPLNWLAFLLPTKYLVEFMSYMVIFKIGLAGGTCCLFLRKHAGDADNKTVKYASLVTSIFYAMSGFVTAYNWDVMWMDCVVLFPLIMLGLEKLVKEKKMGVYCISLGLCIFTNFYLSIMICLFLVIYFVFLFCTETRSIGVIVRFAAGSLLAGGMAAILLIPEIHALMATNFGKISFPRKWESYFSIFDVIARHCMGISTERALQHWPNIYCGAFVFLLVPLYVVNRKIPARRRFGFLAMCGFFLLSFATNGLDFIWHGMNYPDSLPARQSFIYILLVVIMCYESLIHMEALSPNAIVKATFGAGVYFLCVEKFVDVDDFQTWTWLLNLALVVVYAILMYLLRIRKSDRVCTISLAIAFAVVLGESAANMAVTSVGTTSRDAYFKHVDDYKTLYEKTVETQEGFTRFEKFTRKTKNDAALAGFPSASVFSSTLNSKVMEFYKRIGMRHSKVYYAYDGATAFSAALLNVGYVFGEKRDYQNELYELVDELNGLYLYRAKETLPFGYVAPTGYDLPEKNITTVNLTNAMVNQLGVDGLLLKKCETEKDGDDVRFECYEKGIYYGYLESSGTKKVEINGGDLTQQQYRDLKKGCLLYIGQLDRGQNLRMTNADEDDDTPNLTVYVYKLDTDLLHRALDILRERYMENVQVTEKEIKGTLSLQEAGRLIMSVPYEKGWLVWVNGQKTEPSTFGDAFLALDLEPGEYDIRLEYHLIGLGTGILVSVLSIALFATWMIFSMRRKAKNTK